MRLVLDSSVVIAAMKPDEAGHGDALSFFDRLASAQAAGLAEAFAPPELWLETYVVEQRIAASKRPHGALESPLERLEIALVESGDAGELRDFLGRLTLRMRGRRPFSNATDLVYLWAADRASASVVTLDEGLLRYHGVVCDVTRPQHVRLAAR